MDSTEFELLEQSIQRAIDRIGLLESENARLVRERTRLEDKLKDRPRPLNATSRVANPAIPSAERLAEFKARLTKLVDTLKDFEKGL
jgi:hypothetical protein